MFDTNAAVRQYHIQRHIEAGRDCDDSFIASLVRRHHYTYSDAIADIKATQKRLKGHESSRAYYQANRDKAIIDAQNKRCARLGVPGVLDLDDWLDLCERHDYRCVICGEAKPLTSDHIRPISKGGMNIIKNIQPLCKSCNSRKNDRYEEE